VPQLQPIDRAWTVNDVLLRHPRSAAVFARFGIDACCGGANPLEEVARRHRLDADALLAALHEAAEVR
jgi:regulator of cell morphogenesis and NO signaling